MVEIRNGGPQWQMWTKEKRRSALPAITVARTTRAGSAVAVMPATVMVRAGLAEMAGVVVKVAVGMGAVVGAKAADEVRAGASAEETVVVARDGPEETVIVAGAVGASATTGLTRVVRASARTAWRKRSWSQICPRASKSLTWILQFCRI
ncbi:hypothetical protein [Corynebacterium sp. HMSC034A01]|uniref:hypothetical protein n=1 Tax=Corynebacterium sp. HMSC034A01 TaxID=1739295 RepID=UPI001AEFDFBA